MEFSLKSLGISAGGPFLGRWPSSNVLRIGSHRILLDCGEGTQITFQRHGIGWSNLNTILISHLHGDHIFGLPGLLSSWSMLGRKKPLDIFSPAGLQQILEAAFLHSKSYLTYQINWHVVSPENAPEVIFENNHYSIQSLPLRHRIPTVGYLISEKPHPRSIIKEAITKFEIPFQKITAIKNGADFKMADGRIISNEQITSAPPPSRSMAYCVDTSFAPDVLTEPIHGVDLLVHEATFMHDLVENAIQNGHSTALQAAKLAKQAEVGKLILTHFSPRYKDLSPLLAEAQSIFSSTFLAKEGRGFEVPFVKRADRK